MRLHSVSVFAAVALTTLAETTSDPSGSNSSQAIVPDGLEGDDAAKLLQSIQANSTNSCEAACASLLGEFGATKVAGGEDPDYKAAIEGFWSQQQREPVPRCIFRPETAQEVANVVRVSQANKCQFAFRSGGHAQFAGASSADGGITVLFERMAGITLSEDKKVASIGPGAVWSDIYGSLAEHNLAVVGGRVADIGVGGLVTGGGISYFSNQHGWACDNVVSYEVVLADGRIVTATHDSEYSDLYWALRGGGNNVGIVTHFNLETFAHGPLMYGGDRVFTNESFSAAIDAFVDMAKNLEKDPKATEFLSFVLDTRNNMRIAIVDLDYADPKTDAPIFDTWNKIPAVVDNTKINSLVNLTLALAAPNPSGMRRSYWSMSVKLTDREIIDRLVDITFETGDKLAHVPGMIPVQTIQVVTESQLKHMEKNGGNALGLSVSDGPFLLLLQSFGWMNPEDDELVLKTAADMVAQIKKVSKDLGVAHDYIYMNYASQFQDVIAGYGESAKKLRDIARKYDPEGVFQTLQPGYHKLNGPKSQDVPVWDRLRAFFNDKFS
ncbi:hypothetical protein COCMIDRAFT_102147 [Bipolaris oryzae ATCC 44560]|uniref:FAD-binding PCMH-type domain-containing protein n=1 Tax=Bipolaris oryzae ATCC 44560 TaxID=930090 RepID=W6ZHC6_COCMI|nr:uncharacterized protein COCMIDRAFT_102147 [Bipolaris oryzae ATCC 44560]EUC42951.1 hypothetical protein COCMIDRAFT_102147 [Bipolaris oryzae ATCC 44560]